MKPSSSRPLSQLHPEPARRSHTIVACVVAIGVVIAAALVPLPRAVQDFSRSEATAPAQAGFDTLPWSALVPAGWAPPGAANAASAARLSDDDPRAKAALRRLREALDDAPPNPAVSGRAVRLHGYVVPLEGRRQGATEFLLVPYFGACIHTPPPPSNQVVRVRLRQPMPALRTMDPVWVRGTLTVARQESSVAASGYLIAAAEVDRYEPDTETAR